MTDKKLPIAWLPADTFENREEVKFLNLFTELIATGLSFTTRFVVKTDSTYELVVETRITQTPNSPGEVEISLMPGGGYSGLAQTQELNVRGYKNEPVGSSFWKRKMPGTPVASIVSNHLFSGIKHLVGFNTQMNFSVSTASNQGQRILDSIITKAEMTVDRDWSAIIL